MLAVIYGFDVARWFCLPRVCFPTGLCWKEKAAAPRGSPSAGRAEASLMAQPLGNKGEQTHRLIAWKSLGKSLRDLIPFGTSLAPRKASSKRQMQRNGARISTNPMPGIGLAVTLLDRAQAEGKGPGLKRRRPKTAVDLSSHFANMMFRYLAYHLLFGGANSDLLLGSSWAFSSYSQLVVLSWKG